MAVFGRGAIVLSVKSEQYHAGTPHLRTTPRGFPSRTRQTTFSVWVCKRQSLFCSPTLFPPLVLPRRSVLSVLVWSEFLTLVASRDRGFGWDKGRGCFRASWSQRNLPLPPRLLMGRVTPPPALWRSGGTLMQSGEPQGR